MTEPDAYHYSWTVPIQFDFDMMAIDAARKPVIEAVVECVMSMAPYRERDSEFWRARVAKMTDELLTKPHLRTVPAPQLRQDAHCVDGTVLHMWVDHYTWDIGFEWNRDISVAGDPE